MYKKNRMIVLKYNDLMSYIIILSIKVVENSILKNVKFYYINLIS